MTGSSRELKFPNDVLLDGRKVAGIARRGERGRVVLGIGVNVNVPADALPATSHRRRRCSSRPAATLDRAELHVALLAWLERRYDGWVSAAR